VLGALVASYIEISAPQTVGLTLSASMLAEVD